MKILVTGANGFIGRAFCAQASRRGHQVLRLVRRAAEPDDLDQPMVVGTLDGAPWPEIREFSADAVLHLAWTATPGVYLTSPENSVLLEKSKAFLRGCLDAGIPHLVAAGSCVEYAPSSEALSETTSPLAGGFPYSDAKLALSRWLEAAAEDRGRSWSWFRIFYPYGPGEHERRLPSLLMRQRAGGQPVTLQTPDSVKDYVFVDDLAEAICVSLVNGLVGTVNVGSGKGVRIRDLALTVARVLGADPSRIHEANPPKVDPWPMQVANTSRLAGLGWRPRTELENGLRALAERLGVQQESEIEVIHRV